VFSFAGFSIILPNCSLLEELYILIFFSLSNYLKASKTLNVPNPVIFAVLSGVLKDYPTWLCAAK